MRKVQVKGAALLGVPVIVTEQNPKGARGFEEG
mgnify:CR=1 FL=1